jgi:hypothetical protein
MNRKQKAAPEPLEQHTGEKQAEPGGVDQLVREVEERLKNSLRGIVSEVAREYLAPGERTQKADPNT